jgi:glyoxylase-like metal-dependent hydrolase (beta-lactamase superfamily II)
VSFIFEQIRVGGDNNLAYLLGDREAGVAALIDPSYNPERLVERAKAQRLKVTHIINTHGHHDHINGNNQSHALTGAPIAIYEHSPVDHDIGLTDNGTLQIGQWTLRFMHTPGHIDDHLVIKIEEQPVAITGDLLFVGRVGKTWSDAGTRQEWDSLQRTVTELPPETTIWPGHDYGVRPSSTIGIERVTNPFLCCPDLEAFLALKARWPRFIKENGILQV